MRCVCGRAVWAHGLCLACWSREGLGIDRHPASGGSRSGVAAKEQVASSEAATEETP